MKIIFIFIFGFFINTNLSAQEKSELYNLEKKLMLGEKKALLEVASYFDSNKELTEFLGHHIINTTESVVAKRIVNENCIFIESEILITDKTSKKEFLSFLNQNINKISFSEYANAFLITPLEGRIASFDIREISENKKQEVKQKLSLLLNEEWVKTNNIDKLIKEKNPKSLLLISSELYKERYRFDKYTEKENFIDLIRLLTNTEISIEDKNHKLTWFLEKEFYPETSLNLLIYFTNNYKNYKWNSEKSIFENQNFSTKQLDKEEKLFEQLSNTNDSIAKDAFKQLTNCDIKKVNTIANQFEKSNIKTNYALPTFPYRFLKQLIILTDYCKKNNIDYEGSENLKKNFKLLESNLSFNERRKLENFLIENLKLNEITAFEYYSLLNEKSFQLTFSAGRILDVFYSKNWNKLLENNIDLELYIKKSFLYDRLGIIGICNNYLKKFQNSNSSIIYKLDSLNKYDLEINQQIEKIRKICLTQLERPNIVKKEFDGNKDFIIKNLQKEFTKITNDNTEDYEDAVISILSKISFNQIGEALKLIENIEFKTTWKNKYSFIEDDFGLFMLNDFTVKENRDEFLSKYNTLSEYDLYSYYLNLAEINYLNNDKSLNYDKIYEILKFNIVTAFVGGGGGKRDNEVYSLIKLLELKHKTTLGYPKKLCNSNGTYGCSSDDRAKEWIQFFIDKKLLKIDHNNPISFSYE
ncbi:MAG: hypothetical protein V4666_04760 [Bacteroidota bacterium]